MLNLKTLIITKFLCFGTIVFSQENTGKNTTNIETLTFSKKKKYKNPAHEILEKLVKKKHINNPENLKSYSAENHTRMEIAMNSLGNKFTNKQIYKDLKNIMEASKDSLNSGKEAILPVFISENIADYYYQKNPHKTSETIKKSKIEGVGVEDNTLFSQIISSTFIKYNFYNNYIKVLGKSFLSPINDNFALQYDYELIDRDFQENNRGYYKINFKPKRASDLAFEGTLLIDHGSYSLYKITAKISPSANLNFINNVVIEQELAELDASEIHMPVKSKITVETAKLGKNGIGGLLKYYISSKNIKINQTFDHETFKKTINILPHANEPDDAYWEANRHEPLSTSEQKMYTTINEIKNLPSVKSYLEILDIIVSGYYNIGKINLGPVLYTAGYNDIEGLRTRVGFRTSNKFSNQWIIGGYLGYGFRDKQLKYGGNLDYIISREPWIQTGIAASHDLQQVALQYGNASIKKISLFDAFAKNGKISVRKPYWENEYQSYFQIDLLKSITQKITLKHASFNPLYHFDYTVNGQTLHHFKTSEIIWETQWKPGRRNIQSSKNRQIKLADNAYQPIITFKYTRGIRNVFNSNFNYNKFHLNIQQKIHLGILGQGQLSLTGGIIPDKVPYPLLENHLGNNFIFYNKNAFNMMRFFEFTSNKYASLQYTQYLEGLITNSLPIIKKWNWRNHVTFNYLIGDLDSKFHSGHDIHSLNGKPYIEIGYGISNIFRFLKIDFIHRLTHLTNPNPYFKEKPPKFSVKISAQIRL